MARLNRVAMGAAAALAVGSAGCAEFLAQMQAAQMGAQPAPSTEAGGDKRMKLAGIADVADESEDPRVLAQTGDRLRDNGNHESANAAYRAALERNPRDTYVLAAQATNYLRMGTLIKYSNPDGSATTNPDTLRKAEKFFRRAKTLADRAIQVNPTYGTGHFIIAEYYALVGDLDKSLEKFNFIETSKIIPQGHVSSLYAWRGYVKKVKGDEAGSKEDFEKAMDESEPIEFGEYADTILNPPKDTQGRPQFPAIVHAL